MAVPLNDEGEFNYMTGSATEQMYVVSEDCEHPEAAVIALAANNEVVRGTYDPNDEIAAKYAAMRQEMVDNGEVDDSGGRSLNVMGCLDVRLFRCGAETWQMCSEQCGHGQLRGI